MGFLKQPKTMSKTETQNHHPDYLQNALFERHAACIPTYSRQKAKQTDGPDMCPETPIAASSGTWSSEAGDPDSRTLQQKCLMFKTASYLQKLLGCSYAGNFPSLVA